MQQWQGSLLPDIPTARFEQLISARAELCRARPTLSNPKHLTADLEDAEALVARCVAESGVSADLLECWDARLAKYALAYSVGDRDKRRVLLAAAAVPDPGWQLLLVSPWKWHLWRF